MKLYSYDAGWKGGVVCVANSREEAIQKMKNCNAYCIEFGSLDEERVCEHNIEEVIDVGGSY